MAGRFKVAVFAGMLSLITVNTAIAQKTLKGDRLKAVPWSQGWSVGVHWAQGIKNSVRTLGVFNPWGIGYLDYNLISLGLRKKVAEYGKYYSFYSELNFSRIYGDENYSEVFFTPTVSWDYFPWDNVLDTSASIGAGLSYTSIASRFDNSGKKLMASVIIELEFTLPKYERFPLFVRIHHRSTAGIFADEGGSNLHAIGLRYKFN